MNDHTLFQFVSKVETAREQLENPIGGINQKTWSKVWGKYIGDALKDFKKEAPEICKKIIQ